MTRVFLYAYNPFSAGAKELAHELGIKRIKHGDSRVRPRPSDTFINWGSGPNQFPYAVGRIVNDPKLVTRAGNKLALFKCLPSTVRCPAWTTESAVAQEWIAQGGMVVARTVLRGHSGVGIHILEKGVDFVTAPLYTRYVKKEAEFRVHCAFGKIIDAQKKIRDPARQPTNWQVRNHANGFIYVRKNITVPTDVEEQALRAFNASGLDFGAVDVIWNDKQQAAYVLEINTAPGITGQTVCSYAGAFREAVPDL